ncbi:hypothetical protein EVG20_g11325, partial [Dentipellis fragilis]
MGAATGPLGFPFSPILPAQPVLLSVGAAAAMHRVDSFFGAVLLPVVPGKLRIAPAILHRTAACEGGFASACTFRGSCPPSLNSGRVLPDRVFCALRPPQASTSTSTPQPRAPGPLSDSQCGRTSASPSPSILHDGHGERFAVVARATFRRAMRARAAQFTALA